MGAPILHSQLMQARCPAAELTRGTLSLNTCDARCRISGLLRAAKGSPCVEVDPPTGYTACPVWRTERARLWKTGHANPATTMISAEGEWR